MISLLFESITSRNLQAAFFGPFKIPILLIPPPFTEKPNQEPLLSAEVFREPISLNRRKCDKSSREEHLPARRAGCMQQRQVSMWGMCKQKRPKTRIELSAVWFRLTRIRHLLWTQPKKPVVSFDNKLLLLVHFVHGNWKFNHRFILPLFCVWF